MRIHTRQVLSEVLLDTGREEEKPRHTLDFKKLCQGGRQLLNADLTGAPWFFCQFGGMNLSNADLSATIFHGCCFDEANLFGANLTDTVFHGCSLIFTQGVIDLGVNNGFHGYAWYDFNNVGGYNERLGTPVLRVKFGCTTRAMANAETYWHERKRDRTAVHRAVKHARATADETGIPYSIYDDNSQDDESEEE